MQSWHIDQGRNEQTLCSALLQIERASWTVKSESLKKLNSKYLESGHFVPDQYANFAFHFSSVKIFQIDFFNFAVHFIRVQIFQIYFSLKIEKFLFPPFHYNFCIVHWSDDVVKQLFFRQFCNINSFPCNVTEWKTCHWSEICKYFRTLSGRALLRRRGYRILSCVYYTPCLPTFPTHTLLPIFPPCPIVHQDILPIWEVTRWSPIPTTNTTLMTDNYQFWK